MHTVTPDPAFAGLSEEEVRTALDHYDSRCAEKSPDGRDEEAEDAPIGDPVVREIARLVSAYAERLDVSCRESGQIPEEALLYKPKTPIEQAAFHIFTDALHDSLQEADDE